MIALRIAAVALGTIALGAGTAAAAPSDRYLAPPSACAGQERADLPAARQAAVMTSRTRAGLPRLPASRALVRAAVHKNAMMLRCGEFSHDACGRSFDGVIREAGFPGRRVGENIAWGNGPYASPRATMASWLDSAGHRANILRAGWRVQGVAVRTGVTFQGYPGASVWTSQFGA